MSELVPSRLALWVVPVADLGGVARHVLDATRVGVPGWRIVVICPEGRLATKLRAQGISVTAVPFGPSIGFRSSRAALARTVRALRPMIVHSHLAYADVVSAGTRLPAGSLRVTTEHGIAGDDSIYHESKLHAAIALGVHRWRFRRFAAVIAVSESTRSTMRSRWHVQQEITVIPNGVDVTDGAGRATRSSNQLRILSLARLAPEKRIDKLIEAFALVRQKVPTATLTIAGDGPLEAELRRLADRIGVTDATRFVGYVDPASAMAEADVIAQLSAWENLSYTLLDAAARGIPAVATDVGGNSEILGRESLITDVHPAIVAEALLTNGSSTYPAPARLPDSVATMCSKIADRYNSLSRGTQC